MRLFTFILAALLLLWGVHAYGANAWVDHGQAGDGSAWNNASATLEAMMEAARTAGDSVIVCRTHAETINLIAPVSDGTDESPIIVIADDGTYWPDSTGIPTLTCNANYIHLSGDDNWEIHGLKFDTYSAYCIYVYTSRGAEITNCVFTNAVATSDIAIKLLESDITTIRDCVVDGGAIGADGTNAGRGINIVGGVAYLYDSTFDDLADGIYAGGGGFVYGESCTFGQGASEGTNTKDIVSYKGGHIQLTDCTMDDNTKIDATTYGESGAGICCRTYMDASKRPMLYYETEHFNMVSDYGTVRSGGGAYSLKIDVQHQVGLNTPVRTAPYAVYADSAESRDYTIYAYRDAAWDPAPTAAQLYLEVIYASGDSVATAVSSATLSAHSAWTALTVAGISPNHDGAVLCTLVLKQYDADGFIWIDPRLVATDETYHETIWRGAPYLAYFYQAAAPSGSQIMMIY